MEIDYLYDNIIFILIIVWKKNLCHKEPKQAKLGKKRKTNSKT